MGAAKEHRKTLLDAIVALLIAARGNWVLLAEAGGLQRQVRIHEARRKLKLPIENRSEHKDGRVHSYYRLVLSTGAQATCPTPPPQSIALQPQFFPDAMPIRWSDPEEEGPR